MAEPQTNDSTPRLSEKARLRRPMLAVTVVLAGAVAFILTPSQLRLFQDLDRHRTVILANPETRDFHANIAYFRHIDQQLPRDARIFFSGVIGPNNRLFPYYFARTFLFPREMEISLDHRADYRIDGFRGVDCTSPEQLQTNGYDLMIKVEKDHSITTTPLTAKGVFKQ